MKRFLLAIVCVTIYVSSLPGQEIVTLTTPITKPPQNTIRIDQFRVQVFPSKTIEVRWVGENGEPGSAVYSTPAVNNVCTPPVLAPTGTQLLSTLNKGNFSGANTSLVNRILSRLITDCYVPPGTITGTPE